MGWSDTIKSHTAILCRLRPVYAWIKYSCEAENRDDHGGSESENSDEEVMVTPSDGTLTVVRTAPADYIHRCRAEDTTHPFHGMSNFMYTRLVKIEEGARRKRPRGNDSQAGRPPAERYPFCDDYRQDASQVLRTTPALLKVMCEPPLQESNPEGFARLVFVLFKPFFSARDLLPFGSSSWHDLYESTVESEWDPRTKPVRANVASMQSAKRA